MNGKINNNKRNNYKNRKQFNKNELKQGLRILITWLLVVSATWFLFRGSNNTAEQGLPQALGYSEFYDIVKTNNATHKIAAAAKIEDSIQGAFSDGKRFTVNIPADDPDLMRALRENVSKFEVKKPTFISNLFWAVLPTLVFEIGRAHV